MLPLVSIIVPIYNVEKYIERCIHSVLAQTYSNWECICVDDNTPDRSVSLIKNIIADDKRFILRGHERNMGLSAARNSGTLAAKGEYVYYLDSDDEMTPCCLMELVRLAQRYPQAEIIQGSTHSIPEENGDWRDINNKKNYPEYTEDKEWIERHYYALDNFIPVNAWNKLIKRDWIIASGEKLLFKEGIIHEDERWLFDVVECVSAMAFSRETTYLHYRTEGSIMTSMAKSNYKSVEAMVHIVEDALDFVKGENAAYRLVYLTDLAVSRYMIINPRTKERVWIRQYRKSLWKMLLKTIRTNQGYLLWTLFITLLCPLSLKKGLRYVKRVNLKKLKKYQIEY